MKNLGKCGVVLYSTAFALFLSLPAVLADPPDDEDEGGSHGIQSDFMKSLGATGERMRRDHDLSNNQQAQRHNTDAASFEGTHAQSRQSFENSQSQAQQSGGLYNSNGSFNNGSINNGIGGFGIGGFVIGSPIPTSSQLKEMSLQQQAQMQAPPVTAPSGPVRTPASFEQAVRDRYSSGSHFHDPFASFSLPAKRTEPGWLTPEPPPARSLKRASAP